MPATILTGIFTATDGSPVVDTQLVIRPTVKFVSAVGDGGQVPSSVSAVTNEMGRIGTVPTGGSFSDGLSLPVGQYEIAFVGLERAFGGKLTVTQDMVDAGSAPLGAALEPALAVVLPDVTVARNATFAARDLAIAFAESPTPPDPADPASKSAKTLAGEAAASAQAASADRLAIEAGIVVFVSETPLSATIQYGTRAFITQGGAPYDHIVLDFDPAAEGGV